jgi:hypothetical protein
MSEQSQEGEQYMKIGVSEAFESGRIEANQISAEGFDEILEKAPRGQKFVTSNEVLKTYYSELAKSRGRADIVFELEAPTSK